MTSGLIPVPAWKQQADFLFVQVGFSVDQLLKWRSSIDFPGDVFAGVMVVPSAAMARKLSADVPQLAVPEEVLSRIDRDAGRWRRTGLLAGRRDPRLGSLRWRPLDTSQSLS